MKIHVLGTGHATTLKNYNTCFVVENKNQYMLVDGGGGNRIFNQLSSMNIDVNKIEYAFISHNHTDHLLGMVWVIRKVLQNLMMGKRTLPFKLYGSQVCLQAVEMICRTTVGNKFWDTFIGKEFILCPVTEGMQEKIMGLNFLFFDTLSTEMPQMGFQITNKKFLFCGDVPLNEKLFSKFKNQNYVALEAFCLESERAENKLPLTKHFTVIQAAQTAAILNPKNLILWHGKDDTNGKRKAEYTAEAKKFYKGTIFVPDDLETIEII